MQHFCAVLLTSLNAFREWWSVFIVEHDETSCLASSFPHFSVTDRFTLTKVRPQAISRKALIKLEKNPLKFLSSSGSSRVLSEDVAKGESCREKIAFLYVPGCSSYAFPAFFFSQSPCVSLLQEDAFLWMYLLTWKSKSCSSQLIAGMWPSSVFRWQVRCLSECMSCQGCLFPC